MMIREQIQEQIKQAMKDKEVVTLEALRFVWAKIKNAEIDKKAELTDEEAVNLLTKEVKLRKEAVEQFRGGGRDDLVKSEEEKLKIIEEYLPKMMSEEEVSKVVDEVLRQAQDELGGEKDFGQVMGRVMGKVKGKADGKLVAEMVKKKVS